MSSSMANKIEELEKELQDKEMRELREQLNEIQNEQIAADYARTLPAANHYGKIHISLLNGHKYTPEMDYFLRLGAAHCYWFTIYRGTGDGFVGYPANFFNDLIKYYYETKIAPKAIRRVNIDLPLNNPAPWPTVLLQPLARQMEMRWILVSQKRVRYVLSNKHNPNFDFKLYIHFEGDAECYEQMTRFVMYRM